MQVRFDRNLSSTCVTSANFACFCFGLFSSFRHSHLAREIVLSYSIQLWDINYGLLMALWLTYSDSRVCALARVKLIEFCCTETQPIRKLYIFRIF
jgi:hypothetical protein